MAPTSPAAAEPATKASRYQSHWITKSMLGVSLAHDDFDSAILGLTLGRAVRGDRMHRAQTVDGQLITRHAEGKKEVGDLCARWLLDATVTLSAAELSV